MLTFAGLLECETSRAREHLHDPVAAAATAARAESPEHEPPKGIMKVRPSVKPMCEKCKIIRRQGVVLVLSLIHI